MFLCSLCFPLHTYANKQLHHTRAPVATVVEKDDVRYLELTQEEYIENLVKQFSEQIKKYVSSRRMNNGYVKEPVPVGTFFSVVGDPNKGISPPDETEVKQYLKEGYQFAVGSLNWPARHCYPKISANVHQLGLWGYA